MVTAAEEARTISLRSEKCILSLLRKIRGRVRAVGSGILLHMWDICQEPEMLVVANKKKGHLWGGRAWF